MNKYIIVKDNCEYPVSIRCAKIIRFDVDSKQSEYDRVIVEILGLIGSDSSVFHIGEIYEMDMDDFTENYEYISKTKLLAKVL